MPCIDAVVALVAEVPDAAEAFPCDGGGLVGDVGEVDARGLEVGAERDSLPIGSLAAVIHELDAGVVGRLGRKACQIVCGGCRLLGDGDVCRSRPVVGTELVLKVYLLKSDVGSVPCQGSLLEVQRLRVQSGGLEVDRPLVELDLVLGHTIEWVTAVQVAEGVGPGITIHVQSLALGRFKDQEVAIDGGISSCLVDDGDEEVACLSVAVPLVVEYPVERDVRPGARIEGYVSAENHVLGRHTDPRLAVCVGSLCGVAQVDFDVSGSVV